MFIPGTGSKGMGLKGGNTCAISIFPVTYFTQKFYISRKIRGFALRFVFLGTAGCNCMVGLGQGIERAGEKIEKEATEKKGY